MVIVAGAIVFGHFMAITGMPASFRICGQHGYPALAVIGLIILMLLLPVLFGFPGINNADRTYPLSLDN
jgi:hypothetical protein